MLFYRELYATYSREEREKVLQLLPEGQIPYRLKTLDNFSGGALSNRRASGSFGMNMDYTLLYKVYVPKKIFDKAQECLRLYPAEASHRP